MENQRKPNPVIAWGMQRLNDGADTAEGLLSQIGVERDVF